MMRAVCAAAAGVVGFRSGISFAASGDILTMGISGTFAGLDPAYAVGGTPGYDINWAIIPSLVRYDYDADGALTYAKTAYVESFRPFRENNRSFLSAPLTEGDSAV